MALIMRPWPRFHRRNSSLLLLLVLTPALVIGTGCGDSRDRAVLKQADQALKSGNPRGAAEQTKQVLQRSPRNVLALRMLSKVKSQLLKKADGDVRAKNYESALQNLQILLELEPDHDKAQALHVVAKKHKHVAAARTAQNNRELGTAIEEINAAMEVDANFAEALELRDTLMEQRDDEVARLLALAPEMLRNEEAQAVVRDMQQVLKMDSGNVQAQELMREAQVSVLATEKRQNLEEARAFYQEARYEAAIEKAQAILAVDPTSFEAKQIMERSQAEANRPEVVLTGISTIGGKSQAALEIPSMGERAILSEGAEIGPYRAVSIKPDEKTVYLEYIPTGSILPYTTIRE